MRPLPDLLHSAPEANKRSVLVADCGHFPTCYTTLSARLATRRPALRIAATSRLATHSVRSAFEPRNLLRIAATSRLATLSRVARQIIQSVADCGHFPTCYTLRRLKRRRSGKLRIAATSRLATLADGSGMPRKLLRIAATSRLATLTAATARDTYMLRIAATSRLACVSSSSGRSLRIAATSRLATLWIDSSAPVVADCGHFPTCYTGRIGGDCGVLEGGFVADCGHFPTCYTTLTIGY